MEEWLSGQLKEDDFYTGVIQFAIHSIQNYSSQISITDLIQITGYSPKQFIQLFKKYVGLTPKQFHRIMRFNEILKLIKNNETILWTTIAADCGYFDQSHFIRDFKFLFRIESQKVFKGYW